jgi:hypothetical protein
VVKNVGTPAILRALGWPIRDQGLSAFDTQASRLESEVVEMTKSIVVKLFWGSLIGLVAGLVLVGVTGALAISNDIFVMSGPDVTGVKSGVLSWTLLGLLGLAILILLLAAVAHFVAWIGAVLNTAQLPDKTWFVVLLVVGLLGLVFIATAAYVIAGPDGLKGKDEMRALGTPGGAPQQPDAWTTSRPGQQL